MSHFTVLVIGPDHEGQLAPFQENNMGDCPQEYLEFTDQEDEFKEQYENETVNQIQMPDGKWLFPFDDKVKNLYPDESVRDTHLINRPLKEVYSSFEEYCDKYHGHSERNKQKNRYGYWDNPDCKWDWYQVGGRWPNIFKVKEEYCAQALKGQIDWESMQAQSRKNAEETWDKIAAGVGVDKNGSICQPEHPWSYFVGLIHKGEIKIQAARELYYEQEPVQALKQIEDLGVFDNLKNYAYTKKQYGDRAAQQVGSTFAILHNGQWHEQGSMGWWGMSSETDEEAEKWANGFYDNFIKDLPDDTELTVIDCHI